MEFGMARAPRGLPLGYRLCGCPKRLGGELLEQCAQICGVAVSFCLLGVNHRSAPVAVRERLAIAESQISQVCRELAAWPGVKEAIAFSTCNRVELVANLRDASAS